MLIVIKKTRFSVSEAQRKRRSEEELFAKKVRKFNLIKMCTKTHKLAASPCCDTFQALPTYSNSV